MSRIRKVADLVKGETYCVKYNYNPDKPCRLGTFETIRMGMVLFKKTVIPAEGSPDFDPTASPTFGGRWEDLLVYTVDEDPTNGGKRKRKTRRHKRKRTTRKRRTQ